MWSTESRTWRSGPWSLELRDDEFADVSYDGRRVLRSVRAVVRDRNWDTAALVVDRVRDSGATLTLHVRSEGLGSSFRGVVRAEARGERFVVIADLESEFEFASNRTGLVVLHPPQLAGTPLAATHSDGSVEQTAFPRAISPHQPVFDIAALAWSSAGLEVGVAFDGDVFEMEDQRNWSDASYKTYSRPLAIPFPYRIAAEERVRQSVQIDVKGLAASQPEAQTDVLRLEPAGAVPELALGAATGPDPAPVGGGPAVSAVLVELDLRTPNWPAALARAARSGAPLDIWLIARASAPLEELGNALADAAVRPRISRIAVFEADLHVTDAPVLAQLRVALDAAGLRIPVLAGSRAHFTELNREWHIIPRDADGVVFSTTPLFHSRGTEQLVESVAVQRTIAQQAVDLAGGMPVRIGPVTLRPRHNDVATSPPPLPTRTDLAAGYGAEVTGSSDPRQSAPELAAWTIASAAAFAVPGVAGLTYFEEWGDRGIRSSTGEPFPVAAAIEALVELWAPGAELLCGRSPDGLVWAVGARRSEGDVVLVASLDEGPRELRLEVGAAEASVSMEPFSFTRLTLGR
jgi:hypothetical protein